MRGVITRPDDSIWINLLYMFQEKVERLDRQVASSKRAPVSSFLGAFGSDIGPTADRLGTVGRCALGVEQIWVEVADVHDF